MKQLNNYIFEKLKVSTKFEFNFTWEEFITALYHYDDGSFWFEDIITNREFIKLPETEVLNTKYRVIFVQLDTFFLKEKQIEVGLRQSPFSLTVKMIAQLAENVNIICDINSPKLWKSLTFSEETLIIQL